MPLGQDAILKLRGRVPVALEAVLDPELCEDSLGVRRWAVLGFIDEGSVLKLADGTWFGLGRVDEAEINRKGVIFPLDPDDAADLEADLEAGRRPVWALDPLRLFEMGDERSYREAMSGK